MAHRVEVLILQHPLEAVCAALAQLEGDSGAFQPLLQAFDGFVAQQAGFAGDHPVVSE